MTWDNLVTTADLMFAKEGTDLTDYTEAEVIDLKQTQAKENLKWLMENKLGYTYDSSDMEDFLDDNTSFIQEMLACEQLYLWYLEQTAGEGSAAYIKMEHYKQCFDKMGNRLVSLKSDETPTQTMSRIKR